MNLIIVTVWSIISLILAGFILPISLKVNSQIESMESDYKLYDAKKKKRLNRQHDVMMSIFMILGCIWFILTVFILKLVVDMPMVIG